MFLWKPSQQSHVMLNYIYFCGIVALCLAATRVATLGCEKYTGDSERIVIFMQNDIG